MITITSTVQKTEGRRSKGFEETPEKIGKSEEYVEVEHTITFLLTSPERCDTVNKVSLNGDGYTNFSEGNRG